MSNQLQNPSKDNVFEYSSMNEIQPCKVDNHKIFAFITTYLHCRIKTRRRKGALVIIYDIMETQVSLSQKFGRVCPCGVFPEMFGPPHMRKHGPQFL